MGLKRDKLSSVLGTGDAVKGHIRCQYISITFEDLPVLEKKKSNTFHHLHNVSTQPSACLQEAT